MAAAEMIDPELQEFPQIISGPKVGNFSNGFQEFPKRFPKLFLNAKSMRCNEGGWVSSNQGLTPLEF
jgi:hypothetical protein